MHALRTMAKERNLPMKLKNLCRGPLQINFQLRQDLQNLQKIKTLQQIEPSIGGPQSTIQCHQQQSDRAPKFYDANATLRQSLPADFDSFFEPRANDRFEARWAQMALDSPIVKANEVFRQMPPMTVRSDDPAKILKMALTVGGVSLNREIIDFTEKAFDGVTEISKKAGNKFSIGRETPIEIPLQQKRCLGAGVELTGLELGAISFTLGEGKYPEFKDIKGLTVKLDVPGAISNLGRVADRAEVRHIFLTQNQGDFQVNVEVENPMPFLVRKGAHMMYKNVPDNPTVIVAIARLGPDGKPK